MQRSPVECGYFLFVLWTHQLPSCRLGWHGAEARSPPPELSRLGARASWNVRRTKAWLRPPFKNGRGATAFLADRLSCEATGAEGTRHHSEAFGSAADGTNNTAEGGTGCEEDGTRRRRPAEEDAEVEVTGHAADGTRRHHCEATGRGDEGARHHIEAAGRGERRGRVGAVGRRRQGSVWHGPLAAVRRSSRRISSGSSSLASVSTRASRQNSSGSPSLASARFKSSCASPRVSRFFRSLGSSF